VPIDLNILAQDLNDAFRSTDDFKKAWVYREALVAIDFKPKGVRVAFNLTPTKADTFEIQMFGRDKVSILQQAILADQDTGKLPIAAVSDTGNLVNDIVQIITQTMKTHPLLTADYTQSVTGKDVVAYRCDDIPLSAAQNATAWKRKFTIKDVVARDICIGCGACAIATDGKVAVSMNDKGMQCASLDDINTLSADLLKKADAVCPFSDSALNEDDLGAPQAKTINLPINQDIGQYHSVLAGRENNDKRLQGSSSGGLTSWILKRLLESGRIDGVVHVGQSADNQRLFDYRLSFSAEELDRNRKSIYYSTTLNNALSQVKQHPDKTFAVVGVPCFIKSTRLLANADTQLDAQIKYYVGIVCGHMKSSFFAEANAWQLGVPPQDIDKVDFRVKVPGRKSSQYNFSVNPKSKTKPPQIQPSRLLGGSWGHGFFQPNACNFCDDVFAETADIVFGDAWLPKYRDDWRGTNVIVSRNQELSNILQDGNHKDQISIENASVDDVVKSQAGGLRHRRAGLRVRLQDDKDAGLSVPRKRMAPGRDGIPQWRINLVRQRRKLSRLSFSTYQKAKKSGDISHFLNRMKKEVAVYRFMERHKYPDAKPENRKFDVALFGWHHQGNMGGVLTFFALHQILEKVGLSVLVVWRPSKTTINNGNRNNHNLLKKYYTYSKQYAPEKLHELRHLCSHFVTASDQLWAGKWVPFNPEYEFMGAGDKSVKRISVATSFGGDGTKLPFTGERNAIVSHLFKEMDHISVREPSGVDMLADIKVKATQILDPVFLCPDSVYTDIIKSATANIADDKYLFGYILDAEESVVNFGKSDIAQRRGLSNSYFMTTMQNNKAKAEKSARWSEFEGLNFLAEGDMADFVAGISKADFVFTDSFHGACMATIFHRPFICCPKGFRGNSRFALFKQLGLEDRIVSREDLDLSLVDQPIDWDAVDHKLNAMRAQSFRWLTTAFKRDFNAVSKAFGLQIPVPQKPSVMTTAKRRLRKHARALGLHHQLKRFRS